MTVGEGPKRALKTTLRKAVEISNHTRKSPKEDEEYRQCSRGSFSLLPQVLLSSQVLLCAVSAHPYSRLMSGFRTAGIAGTITASAQYTTIVVVEGRSLRILSENGPKIVPNTRSAFGGRARSAFGLQDGVVKAANGGRYLGLGATHFAFELPLLAPE